MMLRASLRTIRLIAPLLALSTLAACGEDTPDNGSSLDSGGFEDVGTDTQGIEGEDAAAADANPNLEACAAQGCLCETDADCDSALCLPHPRGSYCVEECSLEEGCGDPELHCMPMPMPEGVDGEQDIFVCVELGPRYCGPCDVETPCGPGLTCLDTWEGAMCLHECGSDAMCAPGTSCQSVPGSGVFACLPDGGVCGVCIDNDGDGFGRGVTCLGSDPNDANPDVYPGADELCDGFDNDSDGEFDEGFDLQSDLANCGFCDNFCDLPNAQPICQSGACAVEACLDGFYDCDGLAQNGCEVEVGLNVRDTDEDGVPDACDLECADGFFGERDGSGLDCEPWTRCEPGQVEVAPPTSVSDRQCVSCAQGSFDHDMSPSTDCVPVRVCVAGEVEVHPPGPTWDRTCATCEPGSWDHDSDPLTPCAPHTPCDPGFQDIAPASPTQDTICEAWLCGQDEHVQDHVCVPCGAGLTNPSGDDASGDDTECVPS